MTNNSAFYYYISEIFVFSPCCLMSSMKTFQVFLTVQGGLGFQPLIPHSFTLKDFVISNSDTLSLSLPIPPFPSILYRHFLLQNFCTFNL